jgi:PAS domain S-box-containing protein
VSISSSGSRLEGSLSDTLKHAGIHIDAHVEPPGLAIGSVDPAAIRAGKGSLFQLIQALPAAIYVTDARGRITFYNDAAAALWGCEPELGKSEFCGSWKLYRPDGTPLPHDECPMAIALKEMRAIKGAHAVAERPDGTRVPLLAYPAPLFDTEGVLAGAINMLVDITALELEEQRSEAIRLDNASLLKAAEVEIERRRVAEELSQHFSAVVESSDDAILTKDLNGIITSWNRGAERLFGYTAAETIGKSVTLLIPEERKDEEPDILSRIRRGERVDHYETIRRRKDGSLVDISLTVSAVRNHEGKIIGASKIARDITERRRTEEQQNLLLREMNHRVKNLFAVSNSVVSLSARWAKTPLELATAVGERLSALARAHALTLRQTFEGPAAGAHATTLKALLDTIVSPYNCAEDNSKTRIDIVGDDVAIASGAVTSLALLLHEFATNAAKYGALSDPHGHIHVECADRGEQFVVTWLEIGGPEASPNEIEGFGTVLARATVKGQLGGEIVRSWTPDGLKISLSVAKNRLAH